MKEQMEQGGFAAWMPSAAGDGPADTEGLRAVLEAYPWFTTARLLLRRADGADDPRLELPLSCRPAAQDALLPIDPGEFGRRSESEIIDAFLLKGDYKIVPQDDTPDAELSADEPDEDIPASEELAGIYLSQGLTAEAKNMYEKLSLLYPEKSVYFADIIEEIESKNAK